MDQSSSRAAITRILAVKKGEAIVQTHTYMPQAPIFFFSFTPGNNDSPRPV